MIGSGVYLLPASLAAIGSITILAWLAATAGAALIGGIFVWLADSQSPNGWIVFLYP